MTDLRHHLRNLALAVASILPVFSAAQVFPVQANVILTPPYSPYLTDYTAPGAQNLMVQVALQDPTLENYTCRLRLTIEGVGVTLRTSDSYRPQPVTLQGGGIPRIFRGNDLLGYLHPDHLDFAGLSKGSFIRSGEKLPEGIYRFTVEVLDYNRGTVVSNPGMAVAWIVLNDPPLLNLPEDQVKITTLDPVNIVFTWTPRHTASPNAAFTTEYTFRLVEMWSETQNPNDAFLSLPALYEETTTMTSLIYGPVQPTLLAGRRYAWQVQASDTRGRDLFRNEGRSEVRVFQFGDAIGVPDNLRSEGGSASTLSLRWEPPIEGEMPMLYRVCYRRQGTQKWYETTTSRQWSTLTDLASETQYDIKVRAERGQSLGSYTDVLTAATAGATAFACGNQAVIPPVTLQERLMALAPGDVIRCRDFEVVVAEAEGGGGVNGFSGRGVMQVPMFNDASIWVQFNHLMINADYQVLNGEIVSVYNTGGEIAQLVDAIQEIGLEEEPEETTGEPQQTDSLTVEEQPIVIESPGTIDTVYVDDDGEIVVVDTEGQESVYDQPIDSATNEIQEVVIEDEAGNSYVVAANGGVSAATASSSPSQAATSAVRENEIKNKILLLVLNDFRNEISAWLRDHGKGPLEGGVLKLILSLPECFPQDADILMHLQDKTIPHFEEHPGELVDKLDSDVTTKDLVEGISKLFESAEAVDLNKIPESDRNALESAACEALMEVESAPEAEFEIMIRSMSLDDSYYQVDGGHIPEYLWQSGLINPYAAGFVDGLWETIDSGWGILRFMNAWQPMNFSPEAMDIRSETYQFVQFLNDLAQSKELRDQFWSSISESFSNYIDETVSLDAKAMYNQGKLIFDVATLFVGVGEIKAILKGERVTVGIVALLRAIPRDLSRFVFKVRQLGLDIAKTGERLILRDGTSEIAIIADNALQPTVLFEEGERVLVEGETTLVKNHGGKFGFLAKTGKELNFKTSWLPDRTITGNLDRPKGLIGVYQKELPGGEIVDDAKRALQDLNFPETFASNFETASKDGFKMLNTNRWYYVSDQPGFWEEFNRPWLDRLVADKADVVVLSDRANNLLKYQLNPDFTFRTLKGQKIKTGFGKEIEYMDGLVQQGKYKWDQVNGVYKYASN